MTNQTIPEINQQDKREFHFKDDPRYNIWSPLGIPSESPRSHKQFMQNSASFGEEKVCAAQEVLKERSSILHK